MNTDGKFLAHQLVHALLGLNAAQELHSRMSDTTLRHDLAIMYSRIGSDGFNIQWIIPLCALVINNTSEEVIWKAVFDLISTQTELIDQPITPPPPTQSFTSSVKDTPFSFNSGCFQNISETVEMMRNTLKWELNSSLELDHPQFHDTYLAGIPQVEDAAIAVFNKCQEGKDPWYTAHRKWRDWDDRDEKGVQRSLEECISTLIKYLDETGIAPPNQRGFVPSPNTPIPGVVKRKPDLCVATSAGESTATPAHSKVQIASWRKVLVAFELKSSGQDGWEKTWSDIVKYAREIFRHQDSRRFVLGLTLCGTTMRIWEFDRLGATTSKPFDIHENGLMFVKILLSFLWMDDKQLGFDPDLMEVSGQRFVRISRDGKEERLIITNTLRDHAPCIAGRATTCWKTYREGDKSKTPLVVKDSWQYVDRPEEGELIRKATAAGVTNISQYYHHETVLFDGQEDLIRSNVRKSMLIGGGGNPLTQVDIPSPEMTRSSQASSFSKAARLGRGSHSPGLTKARRATPITGANQESQTSQKRSSSQIKLLEPVRKRSRSVMSARADEDRLGRDRVRRRIITERVGKPLRKASCLGAILTGILGGLKGEQMR